MRPPGAFKIAHRGRNVRTTTVAAHREAADPSGDPAVEFNACVGPLLAGDARSQRILASLRNQIVEAGDSANLRIRQVFSQPREIFRLELELPQLGFQRTTLMDRDALEQLLETDEVRSLVNGSTAGL
jgi:hypothetical protein